MKSSIKSGRVLWAAGVALAMTAVPVMAQQQVNTQANHQTDANNRIGSGGFNDSVPQPTGPSGNQIATGNVTNGFAFRGASVDGINLGSGLGDPHSFGGIIPGTGMDQFVANSVGVPTMANRTLSSSTFANGAQPYYGQSQTVAPPSGYTALPNGGGYLPTPSGASLANVNLADTRLGQPTYIPGSATFLPKPGQVVLPGPVDPTAAPSMYTASPLYGVQQWPNNQNQTQGYGATASAMPSGNPALNGSGPIDPAQQQYNSQTTMIRQQLALQALGPGAPPNQVSNGALQPLTPTGTGSNQPLQPLQPISGGVAPVGPQTFTPTAGNVSTSQGVRQYLSPMDLPPATVQSSQYAELRKRMDTYNNSHPQTDEEANREFRSLLQAQRALSGSSGSSGPSSAVPGVPSTTTPPAWRAPAANATAAAPAPLQIDSLATGVKSSTLGDLLRQGEDQIQHQQYDEAIRIFDNAERAVPNNPLILIGRAQAELGGSYYRQAELDLREAFQQDSAVLLGQYNLHKYLGEDRLQYITTSLKQIAAESPENSTAPFLLAYVSYNTHQESQASEWLDEANKRSGGSDQTLVLLKRYWNFNSSNPTTQPTH